MNQVVEFATHIRDPDWVLDSWFRLGPSPAVVCIWRVNQQMIDLSLPTCKALAVTGNLTSEQMNSRWQISLSFSFSLPCE